MDQRLEDWQSWQICAYPAQFVNYVDQDHLRRQEQVRPSPRYRQGSLKDQRQH